MITEEMVFPIGRVFKPHGYKGEIKADINFGPELFENPETPFFFKIDNILVPFFVERNEGGPDKTSFLKFKGLDSDLEVSLIVNREIFALKSFLSELYDIPEDSLDKVMNEFEGYAVVDGETDEIIGSVTDIENGVEYDYLTVQSEQDKDKIIHIPFIEEYIIDIEESSDNGNGRILVSLPEGFLDI